MALVLFAAKSFDPPQRTVREGGMKAIFLGET
jgi:hypothetical protein